MRIPIDTINGFWRSRTPTSRGHIDPVTLGRIIDTPSTVEGRHNRADFERRQREQNPQLRPGMVVILSRAPYRIVEIREKPDDLWPEKYEAAWKAEFDEWARTPTDKPAPQRSTWRHRPVNVVVVPDGGGTEEHRVGPASYVFDVLPEHYAVCVRCGELPPCREEEVDREVDKQVAKSDRLMSIQPGACMGCGETISSRQKTVSFPGPNLWRPDLADGTVRFHARSECSHWVYAYRGQWEDAGKPGFVSAVEQLAMGEG